MKRATIILPDELHAELEEYVRGQDVPTELTSVMQTALREFLQRQEPLGDRMFRPFRITPARHGSGRSDVSKEHDKYLAEDSYKDSYAKQ